MEEEIETLSKRKGSRLEHKEQEEEEDKLGRAQCLTRDSLSGPSKQGKKDTGISEVEVVEEDAVGDKSGDDGNGGVEEAKKGSDLSSAGRLDYQAMASFTPLEGSNLSLERRRALNLSSSPSVYELSPASPIPFLSSSSPPITSVLWESHPAPDRRGGGCCEEGHGGTFGQDDQLSHPEAMLSSPGSDADNCHTELRLPRGMLFYAHTKGGSGHREKAALIEASLRHVLSDPVTGTFMDDAMVARCGHSFGSASLIAVRETSTCMHCGAAIPVDSLVPNYALRAAVQAFKREDQMWGLTSMKAAKRRREQLEQPEGSDLKRLARDQFVAREQTSPTEGSRPRGVQFPFSVSDRVLIKGNKRTPERFVGREAVITTQCLNGWYLVRTLDNGESVRLQYRSLQKLGEMELPADSDAGCSPDQVSNAKRNSNGSDPKGYSSLSIADDMLEGSIREARTDTIVFPAMPLKGVRTEAYSKNTMKGNLTRSTDTAANSSSPSAGTSSTSSPDMQADLRSASQSEVKLVTSTKVGEETQIEEAVLGEGSDTKPSVTAPDKVEAGMHNAENACGQLPDSQVWLGVPDTKRTQTDEGMEVGNTPRDVSSHETGDTFTLRSRRSVISSRGPAVSAGIEPDPYRKVYSSGLRRRGGAGEGVMLEPPVAAVVDNKLLPKSAQEDEKSESKLVDSGRHPIDKHSREPVSVQTMKEILGIMRKDILNLEKQIPWNCLVKSWKMQRSKWRKGVKESSTVKDLGANVKAFRSSLLLTMAGGISDEEWEKRIMKAMESGDVELLVSLWGRLYDDVYKWVQSKPKRTQGGDGDTNLVDTFAELRKQFPQLHVAGLSPAGITTAATLAAADAIAERHLDANVLLAVPMKLLQQHSRDDLLAVREALGREKRHLAAKLAQLERTEKVNREEEMVAGYLEMEPPSSNLQVSSPSAPLEAEMVTIPSTLVEIVKPRPQQGDETDDGGSDTADDIHDADGEATDMSDSD